MAQIFIPVRPIFHQFSIFSEKFTTRLKFATTCCWVATRRLGNTNINNTLIQVEERGKNAYFWIIWLIKARVFSKIPVCVRHFRYIPKIPVYFWTVVSNLIFGKIFGKFRESFRHSKTGVLYRTIFDCRNFSAFDFRQLPKVENFRQTHGLSY